MILKGKRELRNIVQSDEVSPALRKMSKIARNNSNEKRGGPRITLYLMNKFIDTMIRLECVLMTSFD